jgi:hypothetical protein
VSPQFQANLPFLQHGKDGPLQVFGGLIDFYLGFRNLLVEDLEFDELQTDK